MRSGWNLDDLVDDAVSGLWPLAIPFGFKPNQRRLCAKSRQFIDLNVSKISALSQR